MMLLTFLSLLLPRGMFHFLQWVPMKIYLPLRKEGYLLVDSQVNRKKEREKKREGERKRRKERKKERKKETENF